MDATAAHLNFVDLLMVLVAATIIYSGARAGMIAEVFRLLGVCCATFVAIHYYERFADVLRVQFFGRTASTEFFAFIILSVPVLGMFMLISKGWVLILKFKVHKKIDRYGGVALALIRSYFACGLIFFVLVLANHKYVSTMARQSVSRNLFGYVAVDLYRAEHSVFIEKFFPNEKLNDKAFKLMIKKKETRKK